MHFNTNTQSRLAEIILLISATIIGVVTIFYHEMWRDESQAFLLVRDSKNLWELWQHVRYEGHPFLWHFLLFVAYHLFPSIYTIQVLHLIIGLGVVALIIFYSPFSFFEKFLLCFSYFFSFEYLVISRNYSIGIFLLFAALVVHNKMKSAKSIVPIAILLGLCVNANIYAVILGCFLFITILFKLFPINKQASYKSYLPYAAILIFTFLLIISALQLYSPADRTPKLKIAQKLSLAKTDKLTREISGTLFYFPNPQTHEQYWGSNVFEIKWLSNAGLNKVILHLPQVLALLIIVLLLYSFKRSPSVIFFFVASFVALFIFMAFVFNRGLLRHTGAFFVLLITSVWLYRSQFRKMPTPAFYFNGLFAIMLIVQFAGSLVAHVGEMRYQFSGAKNAASFLLANNRDKSSIIIHPDFAGLALLHYAKIKNVYYCTIKDKGSFIKFNDKRKPCTYTEVIEMAQKENIETLVVDKKRGDSLMNEVGYRLIYEPKAPSTVVDENFYIYGRKK